MVPTSGRCSKPVRSSPSACRGEKPLSRCESDHTLLLNAHVSAIGNLIIAAAVAFNGMIGSRHHSPFPIATRASLGFYFSYIAVVSRLVLGLIYFG